MATKIAESSSFTNDCWNNTQCYQGEPMINNSSLQKWDRLQRKQLSQQFVSQIITGLNCSPFEAAAVLETVEQVYGSYFQNNGTLKPGQLLMTVVSASAPPQLPLAECPMVSVRLTLDAEQEDLAVRQQQGLIALRQHRLERLCREAYQQGGLLTLEDLAYRLLNTSVRTLSRDLAALRRQEIILPLRSTIKDMGRSITHRVLIVKQWLQGRSYSEIARSCCHSVDAVGNYVEKFKRVVMLSHQSFETASIGFVVRLSVGLVEEYLELYRESPIAAARDEELRDCLKKTILPSSPPLLIGPKTAKPTLAPTPRRSR
jgi:hypothetical protein